MSTTTSSSSPQPQPQRQREPSEPPRAAQQPLIPSIPLLLNPCLRSDIQFKNLPAEIIFRILSYLTPHDLVQSAACCREWYHLASDPLLWRTLDLSPLASKTFNPATATSLTSRLRSCRTFILATPAALTTPHITALLHFLSAAPMLQRLQLTGLGHALNAHSLEHHFRMSQSRSLLHVELAGSNVTTPAVVAMMEKHKSTLLTLDLSHTSIGDGTLRAVSTGRVLTSLDISNCPSISRTSIRNFLTKRFPGSITTLSLRCLKELKITWLYELLRLPTSANLRTLNVEGCERLTLGDLKGLQEFCDGRKIRIMHDAREAEDSVWGYRRYIEYLGEGPSLPERLGENGEEEPTKKESEKDASKDSAPRDADKSCPKDFERQREKERRHSKPPPPPRYGAFAFTIPREALRT